MYKVAELFCGCGGFSFGFEMSGRFETVLGVDIKHEALKTFSYNHIGNPISINKDIREIDNDEIIESLKLKGVGVGDLDCLIGGPPCQGFSQMRRDGKRDSSKVASYSGYNKLLADERNDLILRFLEIAEVLMPKFVVIENVKQIRNHVLNGKAGGFISAVEEILGALGYDVHHQVINAADYGVPQLRERAIIIASRIGHASFPVPDHSESPSHLFKPWVTVSSALSDLPKPSVGKDALGGEGLNLYARKPTCEYQTLMRDGQVTFPYNHITRKYSNAIINIIKEMPQGANWDEISSKKQEEYEQLLSNALDPRSREEKYNEFVQSGQINPVFYKRYYWSAYTRLSEEKPALTITANANFLGSGRFTHPIENRGITAREAARLQSFPDSFKFITDKNDTTKTEKNGIAIDMIGEAVPPVLAMKIALHIARELDSNK
ncbi:TPA: DNA cytosine methyltransferase [Aeromonas veronii]